MKTSPVYILFPFVNNNVNTVTTSFVDLRGCNLKWYVSARSLFYCLLCSSPPLICEFIRHQHFSTSALFIIHFNMAPVFLHHSSFLFFLSSLSLSHTRLSLPSFWASQGLPHPSQLLGGVSKPLFSVCALLHSLSLFLVSLSLSLNLLFPYFATLNLGFKFKFKLGSVKH